MTEAELQVIVRLEASRKGIRLWRNNTGAAVDDRGRHIRYGLANESANMSRVIKSSDLIGITPYVVNQADVGRTLGIFTAVEVKRPGWKFKGTPREIAQKAWLDLISAMGGIAKFISKEGQL